MKVAAGLFAAGHLGELTRVVPFEMVDAVLAECGAVEQRLRKLPARVVVYLLLAAALFEECGYLAVWRKLTAALEAIPVPQVTGAGLWDARRRLGVRPMRALFDLLRGPACSARTCGARWKGLLTVAIDGTFLDVPDSPALRARLGKGSNQHAAAGYPQICLTALVACGTRTVLDAAFGPRSRGETVYATRLLRSLDPQMIALLDRGFSGTPFLTALADTGAAFLARISAVRKPPVLARHDDGSYLSRFGALPVRVIECEITVTTRAGHRTCVYRLATSLLDHHRHPASDLVSLYHERWEIETAYFEIKKTMLGRRVLRSRTWPGIAQEVYALLSAYQILRTAIADATSTAPGTDPDRASFSIALRSARDQIVQAAGITTPTTTDLTGTIGRIVLDQLMPARRPRASPRTVKRPLSRYAYKSLNTDRRTHKTTLNINILTPANSP